MATMARDLKPVMQVALEGDGLSPDDVPVGELVKLLEATVAALEAVARDEGLEVPVMRLSAVRQGSAAYDLTSQSPGAPTLVRRFCTAARQRGEGFGPGVRRALQRLHDSGKIGSIRLTPKVPASEGKRASKPVHLAAPIEAEDLGREVGTEIYGRIVGLAVKGENTVVRIKLDDGGTEEFRVDGAEEAALRLFNKTVRARVAYTYAEDVIAERALEALSPWAADDLLTVLRDVRDELEREGVAVDVEEWLREVDA